MSRTDSFDRAALLLPGALRAEALFQPEEVRMQAEELRLRSGLGAWLCLRGGVLRFQTPVGREEIQERDLGLRSDGAGRIVPADGFGRRRHPPG